MPPLPPGIPVPVPRSPDFVEKHREPDRPSPGRDYGSNRHDNRDYRHDNSRWRNDRGRDWHPRSHGSVHRSLPAEAFALSVAGAAFFFHMGTYYRHTPTGYVVVQAPFGARVRALPERCSPLYIDGRRYYDCDDVYYEPQGDEYVVIERPSAQQAGVEIGDEVRIKADFLNVRSGPGTRYRVVSNLYRDDIVEIGGMDGEWYYVQLPDGSYGWIMRGYIRLHRNRHK
ncbi:MAG: SH3 domain-containing protein [Proteobacteria bacterium]|nr:SH3 domain-containing protein [Pseudomonadota bacterium]